MNLGPVTSLGPHPGHIRQILVAAIRLGWGACIAWLVCGCDQRSPPAPPAAPVPAPTATPAPVPDESPRVTEKPAPQQSQRDLAAAEDSAERLLLLLPQGPVVAEVRFSTPQGYWRADLTARLEEAWKKIDLNGDGVHAWTEAANNTEFLAGPFAYDDEPTRRQGLIRSVDSDRDGLVSRAELRRLLQAEDDFKLQCQQFLGGRGLTHSPLWRLCDANEDGTLQAKEIAAAPARLSALDTDDDELLTLVEAGLASAATPAPNMNSPPMEIMDYDLPPMVLRLGDRARWSAIRNALAQAYAYEGWPNADSPLGPQLADALDLDRNGSVQPAELTGLNDVSPTWRFDARLDGDGLSWSGRLPTEQAPGESWSTSGDTLRFRGLGGEVLLVATAGPKVDLTQTLAAQFTALDQDQNGYLEANELATVEQQLPFEDIDQDRDAKVYPPELEAYARGRLAAAPRRVEGTTGESADGIWTALDQREDGRLSAREMRTANQQLLAFDANADGQLTSEELPMKLVLRFAVTRVGNPLPSASPAAAPAMLSPAAEAPTSWHAAMDANGDGEISNREFLGDAGQFAKLDANGDGFLTADETEHAAAEQD